MSPRDGNDGLYYISVDLMEYLGRICIELQIIWNFGIKIWMMSEIRYILYGNNET